MLKLAFAMLILSFATIGMGAVAVSVDRDMNSVAQATVHDLGLDFAHACRESNYCPNRVRHDAIIYTVRTVQWLEQIEPVAPTAGL